MNSPIDFLMIYPHPDVQAYSQRILLGILKKAGLNVHLAVIPEVEGIKNNNEIKSSFLDLIDRSDIIGFGFMSSTYSLASYLTSLIKSSFDNKHVVWGGPHPSISYRQLIGEPDGLILGEADIILPEYIKAVRNGTPLNDIPHVVTDNENYIKGDQEWFLADLDTLPISFYSKNGQTLFLNDKVISDPIYFENNFNGLHLLTTRGCPYSCTYCANSYLNSFLPKSFGRLRKRSISLTIKDILACMQVYNIPAITVEDDLFLARKDAELIEFVEMYNKEVCLPIAITGITPSLISKSKIDIIKNLPLFAVRVGIETLSSNGLEVYKRQAINKNVEKKIALLNDLNIEGLNVHYDFILDNPYETEKDYIESLRMLAGFPKPYNLILYHLTMYEGTEIRQMAIQDNIIVNNDSKFVDSVFYQINDTYINNLFMLIKDTFGYTPKIVIHFLTSDFIVKNHRIQKLMNVLIKYLVAGLKKTKLQILWLLRLQRTSGYDIKLSRNQTS